MHANVNVVMQWSGTLQDMLRKQYQYEPWNNKDNNAFVSGARGDHMVNSASDRASLLLLL